jgi:hypothetical protein
VDELRTLLTAVEAANEVAVKPVMGAARQATCQWRGPWNVPTSVRSRQAGRTAKCAPMSGRAVNRSQTSNGTCRSGRRMASW